MQITQPAQHDNTVQNPTVGAEHPCVHMATIEHQVCKYRTNTMLGTFITISSANCCMLGMALLPIICSTSSQGKLKNCSQHAV
jgi:hypothetical protein